MRQSKISKFSHTTIKLTVKQKIFQTWRDWQITKTKTPLKNHTERDTHKLNPAFSRTRRERVKRKNESKSRNM